MTNLFTADGYYWAMFSDEWEVVEYRSSGGGVIYPCGTDVMITHDGDHWSDCMDDPIHIRGALGPLPEPQTRIDK